MRIRGASVQPGGSPVAIGQKDITTPVGDPPLRIYRSTFYLDFITGDAAEEVRIDVGEGGSRLGGRFDQLEYDAIGIDGATVAKRGSGLVVDIRALRDIARLVFDPSRVAGPGYELKLYRMDGSEPVGDPFHTTLNGTLFQSRYDGLPPTMTLIDGIAEGYTGFERDLLSPIYEEHLLLQVTPTFGVDRREQRFFLQVTQPGGTPLTLNPGDLREIRVRGAPVNPRIGIALPGSGGADNPQPEDAVFFWRGRGEIGESAPLSEGMFPSDNAFGDELQRLITRYASVRRDAGPEGVTLPSPLRVALVFESDCPCRVRVDDLEIAYALERKALPDGESKKVLRYVSGRKETQEIRFAMAAGARVDTAELRVEPSFNGDRDASASNGSKPLPRRGGHLSGDQVVAQPFTLPDALRVSAISLAVLPTSRSPELTLEVREDRAGTPGRTILSATVQAADTVPRWYDVRFDEPVLLPTSPHWLLLRANTGSAIWLAGDADANGCAMQVLRPGNIPGSWQATTRLDGRRALHRLRTRSGPGAVAAPVEIQVGEEHLELSMLNGGNTFGSDVRNALDASLSSTPDLADVGLTVTFSAIGPGRLTVYPLDLVYHLE